MTTDGLYRQTPDGARSPMLLGALVARGKSAEIYAIESDGSGDEDGRVAKIYLTPAIAAENADKLEAMLPTAPDLPAVEKDGALFPLIAWPDALIVDAGGTVCGYTMPRIDEAVMLPLIALIDPQSPANRDGAEAPADFVLHGYVAYNLAHDMAEMHRCGHRFNRLDWNKIRFHPQLATLAVLATDALAISGPDGRFHAGAPPLAGTFAPELTGKTGPDFPRAQDEFALAKAISQLLQRGIHPSNQMPAATRALFDRAFAAPVNGVCARPAASEWAAHLATLLTDVITPCDANPLHLHYGKGCGACVAEAEAAAEKAAAEAAKAAAGPYAGAFERVDPARVVVPKRGTPGWLIALMIGVAILGMSYTIWEQMPATDAVDAAADASAEATAAATAAMPEPAVIASPTPPVFIPFAQAETRYASPGGTVGYINLRSTTDHLSESNIIITIPMGDAVTATGTQADGDGRVWVRVTYNGMSGFVSDRVLSTIPPSYMAMGEAAAAAGDAAQAPPPAQSNNRASFDCGAAAAWAEVAVCGDARLASLDREMAGLYGQLIARLSGNQRAMVRDSQRSWLGSRADCRKAGSETRCLTDSYAQRIAALRAALR